MTVPRLSNRANYTSYRSNTQIKNGLLYTLVGGSGFIPHPHAPVHDSSHHPLSGQPVPLTWVKVIHQQVCLRCFAQYAA